MLFTLINESGSALIITMASIIAFMSGIIIVQHTSINNSKRTIDSIKNQQIKPAHGSRKPRANTLAHDFFEFYGFPGSR